MQGIDDYRRTQPRRTSVLHEPACAEGLTACVDPIVNEEHLLACLQKALGKAQAEMAISVIGRRCALEPRVTVSRRSVVLSNLHETHSKMYRDDRTQERAA
jgi:hypothetical protein